MKTAKASSNCKFFRFTLSSGAPTRQKFCSYSSLFKVFIILFSSFVFLTAVFNPQSVFAAEAKPLVPCDTRADPRACRIADIFDSEDGLIKRVIDFILIYLIVPVATISVAVAGFRLIIAGDKPGEREKSKEILISVVIGFVLAFGAWLVINTVLKFLVIDEGGKIHFNAPLEDFGK